MCFNLGFKNNHTKSLNKSSSTSIFPREIEEGRREYINPNPNPKNKLKTLTYLKEGRNKKTRRKLISFQSLIIIRLSIFFFSKRIQGC